MQVFRDDEQHTALYIESLKADPEAFRAWSGQQVLLIFWPASTAHMPCLCVRRPSRSVCPGLKWFW